MKTNKVQRPKSNVQSQQRVPDFGRWTLDIGRVFYCLFTIAFCFSVCLPVVAQRTKQRRPASVAPRAVEAGGTELSTAAQGALDAALAALKQNSLAEAERSARAAVAAAPQSAQTHNILGVILDRQGRRDEAVVQFNTAIGRDPNFVSARNNLGRILAESGKTKEAIAEFERVLKIDPAHSQAHYNLGALYGQAGDFVKAAEYFAHARESAPDDPQLALAFLNVAYRANRQAETESAADLVERSAASDARALFALATVLAQNKQYERAARVFARVNELVPNTYEILYNLGVALYNLDRNDEAARYLAEAADLNPAPAETHFRLGLIASARNDYTNAVEEFKHAVERQPKESNYHYMLGREYYRAGFLDGAINEFTRAIEIEPKHAVYVLARADANYRKGEAAASAADFDFAATLDPNNETIEYWQGYAHRVAGNFDLARQYLEKFVTRHPDHVEALASLGFVNIETGRLEDAEAPLNRGLSLDPKNVPLLYDYARLAVKRRNYAEAVTRLRRLIDIYPAHTQAHYQLFLAYSRLKQTEKAQIELAEFKRLEALEKQVKQERIQDDKLRTQQMLGQSPQ
ncbi:MAG: tetratricopeptide repeat protein [Pyrinomonadaceae bacterium]